MKSAAVCAKTAVLGAVGLVVVAGGFALGWRMEAEGWRGGLTSVLGASSQTPGENLPVASGATRVLYVSPGGLDEGSDGSRQRPFRTITQALKKATPGTRIEVAAGEYTEHIVTARNGKRENPIVLKADGKVVLSGEQKEGRIMEVRHDYYIISGFEFTGRDILLWLQEADYNVITSNYFHQAERECVRLKYQSSGNLFADNRVEDCGREDFGRGGGGKNGEGVYIGTAPEQLDKNPTRVTDRSDNNLIRNNSFVTRGNECVDIKEGATNNIVEFNDCTGQRDPESGGMDSRGSGNIFRYNHIYGNRGAGIRFGGDKKRDGINNEAYGNSIEQNDGFAIKVQRKPQGLVCGNTHRDNRAWSNQSDLPNLNCPFVLEQPGRQE